ncbi:MAG: hypothetical protein H0X66_06940 [Verrucomicrobia bacterium]|nr:hypothetical protein [Verrucomicrobiota bacterium]
MPESEQLMSLFLFVNDCKEETRFLTSGLPVRVIQTEHLDTAKEEMKSQSLSGIFIDIAFVQPGDIADIKSRSLSRSHQHDVPVFVLAHAAEVSAAIQYVRQGAQGFLVKGLSDSGSVQKLMEYATSQP